MLFFFSFVNLLCNLKDTSYAKLIIFKLGPQCDAVWNRTFDKMKRFIYRNKLEFKMVVPF